MCNKLVILQDMPSALDFYDQYWNKAPFVVRAAIPSDHMAALISGDELAGLAMEQAPQSRMVKVTEDRQDWTCRYGPFDERDFATTGDADWSLLVQNVEQFHPEVGSLLRYFDFAPRWLMDDIMVSFSSTGGSVGPHMDSYHVFIVQGTGRRRWKVGRHAIHDEVYRANDALQILAGDIQGDEIEMACGDVLYIPPRFGHEGTTIEDALTFSVGFLGPKHSELFSGYGQYLSEHDEHDQRYVGDSLSVHSAGSLISYKAHRCTTR